MTAVVADPGRYWKLRPGDARSITPRLVQPARRRRGSLDPDGAHPAEPSLSDVVTEVRKGRPSPLRPRQPAKAVHLGIHPRRAAGPRDPDEAWRSVLLPRAHPPAAHPYDRRRAGSTGRRLASTAPRLPAKPRERRPDSRR